MLLQFHSITTVYFASFRISQPCTREIYGWFGWALYIAACGPYNHKFPGYGGQRIRMEAKLTPVLTLGCMFSFSDNILQLIYAGS